MSNLTPNPTPKGQICGSCRYAGTHVSANSGQEKTLIACHRYPPQRLGRGAVVNRGLLVSRFNDTGWPHTEWEDWCGEWLPRMEEQA